MHKLIIIFLAGCIAAGAQAQPKGFTPVANAAAVKQELSSKAAATKSLRTKFTQEKNLQLLSEKIVSHGTFLFLQPDKVRMEYTEPFSYLMVINKDQVTIRDGQKTNTFSAHSNKMFTVINRVILDCVRGTVFGNKEFNSEIYSHAGQYLIVMKPLKKEIQAFFESIHVFMDATDGTVVKMDLREPGGDNTLITFTEKEINAALLESDFKVQ